MVKKETTMKYMRSEEYRFGAEELYETVASNSWMRVCGRGVQRGFSIEGVCSQDV